MASSDLDGLRLSCEDYVRLHPSDPCERGHLDLHGLHRECLAHPVDGQTWGLSLERGWLVVVEPEGTHGLVACTANAAAARRSGSCWLKLGELAVQSDYAMKKSSAL